MAEQHAASTHRYDPLWNNDAGTGRKPRWTRLAVGLSIAVHAGLILYIYETKFVPHYKVYQDTAITAELLPRTKPPAPPPEPAKPPPLNRAPPPATPLTPRVSTLAPDLGITTPLTIAPPEPPAPIPAPALPQEPAKPPPPRAIANPDWSSRPSGEDMARYYPERAQRLEKNGTVTLQCQVTAKGAVAACAVLAEDPADFGFGEAALKLSRLFKMKPKMEDGQAVEGATVKIPIAFRIG